METTIKSIDGYNLELTVYEPTTPTSMIMVAHGMEEHQGYYKEFAEYFKERNYLVVTANMRGHGPTQKTLGYFSDNDGYKLLVEDQKAIVKYMRSLYEDLPLYLFAHSMGTIISRNTLLENSQLFDKVILCGYPNKPFGVKGGILLAKMIKGLKSPTYISQFLEDNAVGAFNKSIKNPKTNCDWLAHNEAFVQRYIDDPLCGVPFTCSAHLDLFTLVSHMHNVKLSKNVKCDLPILLVSGQDDPCTGGSKGRKDTLNALKKLGYKDIEVITFPNARHVILEETCKQNVLEAIDTFIQK